MAVCLTKEELLELLEPRQSEFEDKLKDRLKPQLPIIFNSYESLASLCVDVLHSYIDAVFHEET